MKSLVIASALTLVGSCATTRYSTKIDNLKNGIHLNLSYGGCVLMGFVFFLFLLETRKLIIFEEPYPIFVQGI